jgi:hypothetical protein
MLHVTAVGLRLSFPQLSCPPCLSLLCSPSSFFSTSTVVVCVRVSPGCTYFLLPARPVSAKLCLLPPTWGRVCDTRLYMPSLPFSHPISWAGVVHACSVQVFRQGQELSRVREHLTLFSALIELERSLHPNADAIPQRRMRTSMLKLGWSLPLGSK